MTKQMPPAGLESRFGERERLENEQHRSIFSSPSMKCCSFILESIDEATFRAIPYTCASHLVLMGKIHERWASEKTPKVMNRGAEMLIIHSIEPYTLKRSRE